MPLNAVQPWKVLNGSLLIRKMRILDSARTVVVLEYQ